MNAWKHAGLALVVLLTGSWAFAKPIDDQFKAMDTNADGKISAEEHANAVRGMFNAMDTNGDGKVTADEMTAFHDHSMATKTVGLAQLSSAEKIKQLDTDGDGILTLAEHTAGAKQMFERMDTDKDGFLTPAEFAAGHQRLMKKPS